MHRLIIIHQPPANALYVLFPYSAKMALTHRFPTNQPAGYKPDVCRPADRHLRPAARYCSTSGGTLSVNSSTPSWSLRSATSNEYNAFVKGNPEGPAAAA